MANYNRWLRAVHTVKYFYSINRLLIMLKSYFTWVVHDYYVVFHEQGLIMTTKIKDQERVQEHIKNIKLTLRAADTELSLSIRTYAYKEIEHMLLENNQLPAKSA